MNKNITLKNFITFVYPSVLLMCFISIYTIVDSIFISRFVGPYALAGINISMPIYSVAFACGIMFATGGSAIIAIRLGEGRNTEADRNFTTLITVGGTFGIISAALSLIFRSSIIGLLGATDITRAYALDYSFYLILSFPFLIMKVIFESILRVDNSPKMALYMTVIGGVINIILDYLFIVHADMGIAGAGLGTLLGIIISSLIGISHFQRRKGILGFSFSRPSGKFLLSTITNGSSEMVNEVALALTTITFNLLTLKYLGEDGVAAISVILAVNFFAISIFLGFSTGTAPLISFNYGRKSPDNIQRILSYSKRFILCSSILLVLVMIGFSRDLVGIYLDPGDPVYPIAVRGFRFFAIGYLFVGINIFGSAFFTAFENGKISAMISFTRTFIFFFASAALLPPLMGADGIWFIAPISDTLTAVMVILLMKRYERRYEYRLHRPGREMRQRIRKAA